MNTFFQIQSIGVANACTPLFPTGRSRLIHGDCLQVMRALPAESFDVLYLDPPFFSGEDYALYNSSAERVHGFADTWAGGLAEYLDWLEERLLEMHRLLKPTGAIFVHLDWHATHYVKVIMDRLFGYDNFQNEFIWYYSGGGASKKRFARKHDNILYYTKSKKEWKFYADRVRVEYKWTGGQKRADGSERNLEKGKLPDDVWEQHGLLPWAVESLGYPTQKPEALLERLLLATSDVDDVVGDFFCGSGTTAAVAQRLGRRWVTADESRIAINLAAERLAEVVHPGSIPRPALVRSRALAKSRFAEIIAAEERLGLSPALLAAQPSSLETVGFEVERIYPAALRNSS